MDDAVGGNPDALDYALYTLVDINYFYAERALAIRMLFRRWSCVFRQILYNRGSAGRLSCIYDNDEVMDLILRHVIGPFSEPEWPQLTEWTGEYDE